MFPFRFVGQTSSPASASTPSRTSRSLGEVAWLCFLGLSILFTGCAGKALQDRKEVAVFVNGEPILHRDVVAEADRWITANKARDQARGLLFEESGRETTRDALRRDVLEALIERKLIAQQLKADGLKITEAEVDAHLAAKAKALGRTTDQAESDIEAQGKTLADVKERVRWHHLGVEKLYNLHATERRTMTEADALKLYNEFPSEFDREEQRRVSHILIRVPPEAPEVTKRAAREKAEALLKRIRNGERLADLAALHSDDELSQERGGDRGFSGRGIIRGPGDDPFGDAAFAMKRIGEISGVVETRDGFHIIELTGLREARRLTFAEVKNDMIADFRRREIAQFWAEFGGQLRASANLDWTSHELFRQAHARRRQEIHNARIERMIARERAKAQQESAAQASAVEPELRSEAR